MLHGHPAEIHALQERAERAELRIQHLNEMVSNLLDNQALLQRQVGAALDLVAAQATVIGEMAWH